MICLLAIIPIIERSTIDPSNGRLNTLFSISTSSHASTNISLTHELSSVSSTISSTQDRETIALIVDSSIHLNLSDVVSQYRKDLNATGYHTILYTDPIATAEDLKEILSEWYENECLIGAVLIGRLPYAQYHHDASSSFSAETFICDLFLMDLDGLWSDSNPTDGIYDAHTNSPTADIYPEIFVGRIDPACLTWGAGAIQHIRDYLTRVHDYRTGGVQRNHQAIAYIDDDWSGYWGTRWSNDLGLAYERLTVVQVPTTYTNATDWRTNRLTQNYQWGHLCAHSNPTTHYFGPDGLGEGTVSSSQVRVAPPSFNFYNLFCCSGAKWTVNDNLGVTYTFSGDHSLATIGSSKTGSMMDCDQFYVPLSLNATLGESLVHWFSQSLTTTSTAGSEYLEWYYGMNIIGDPLLSINYDTTVLAPQIISTTHPDQDRWYTNSRPEFNWTIPPDVNEIVGYFYILDQNPSTLPTPLTGSFTPHNGTTFEQFGNGTWYFHVVARDSVGNVGTSAAHYQIHIDTTSPEITIVTPVQSYNYSSSSLVVSWIYRDEFSDYSHAEITIDNEKRVNTTELDYLLGDLSEGPHILNITLFDEAGNSVFDFVEFRVDITNPEIVSLKINEDLDIWPHLNVEWIVYDISDYRCAEVYLDGVFITVLYAPECSFLIDNSEFGKHLVNVTIFDWANRTDSLAVEVSITDPAVYYVQLTAGCILVTVVIIVGWRKKKN